MFIQRNLIDFSVALTTCLNNLKPEGSTLWVAEKILMNMPFLGIWMNKA
jgi:hypothetical protein